MKLLPSSYPMDRAEPYSDCLTCDPGVAQIFLRSAGSQLFMALAETAPFIDRFSRWFHSRFGVAQISALAHFMGLSQVRRRRKTNENNN